MSERILFVDDEPNVLQSIRRQLRKRFDLATAEGGEAALKVLQEQGPFAVIVSDMRMPGMTGVELLSRVKDIYPDMVRLMLTGNADQETAMEAVNNGQIFRFLTKPCPQATFVTSLALALRQHRLVTAEKELLQQTLKGSITVLTDLLSMVHPLAFSSGPRMQRYVLHIAERMQLPQIWQFEIAAMMSQVGCASLPAEVLNKVFSGQEMTEDEQEMYQGHPQVGASLLEKIPRLENITKMISMQLWEYEAFTPEIQEKEYEEVIIGAQILKVVNDFDRLISRGHKKSEAIATLVKQRRIYNPEIVKLLPEVEVGQEGRVLALKVNQIVEGMVAVDDVHAKNGTLIIPAQQVISTALLQGLKNFAEQVGVLEPINVRAPEEGEGEAEQSEAT